MKCLIIGGGIGGATVAKHLRKIFNDTEIILVEPKEYMEIAWAAYRSPFDEKVAQDSLLDLGAFCKANNIQHKRSVVTELTDTKAKLKQDTQEEEIEFDVCVIATGAGHSWPACGRGIPENDGSKDARLKVMKEEGERLVKNANSVLIVGGGLIGVELAGEVAFHQKQSKPDSPGTVTLVHSGGQLCPEMGPAAGAMIQRKVEKLGVKVILNDKVNTDESGKTTLASNGEEIKADQVVLTVGNKPLNSFIQDGSWLDENGWVKSDEYFRVQGTGGKVFVIGDCTKLMMSSASKILDNGAIIANNIRTTLTAIEAKQDLSSLTLKKHKASGDAMVATIGPKDGVAKIGGFHTQFFIPGFKNATMFFFKIKGELGIK